MLDHQEEWRITSDRMNTGCRLLHSVVVSALRSRCLSLSTVGTGLAPACHVIVISWPITALFKACQGLFFTKVPTEGSFVHFPQHFFTFGLRDNGLHALVVSRLLILAKEGIISNFQLVPQLEKSPCISSKRL